MNRPQVGSKVTVVVKNHGHKPVWVPSWNAFTAASPETNTYTGTVVKPDAWLKNDEFNLTTGLSHFPVRTISLKNVISIDGADVDVKTEDDVKVVDVQGSKGNSYQVIVKNGVAESCSCPAFQFRGGRCKHLQIAVGAAPVVVVEPKAKPAKKPQRAAATKAGGSKLDKAKVIYADLAGKGHGRAMTIQRFIDVLGMSKAGASTYYHNIKKGL